MTSTAEASRGERSVVLAFLAWDQAAVSIRTSVDAAVERITRAAAEAGAKDVLLAALPQLSSGTVDAMRTRRLVKAVDARLKALGKYRVASFKLDKANAVALEVDSGFTYNSTNSVAQGFP